MHTMHISEINLEIFKQLYSSGVLDDMQPKGINYDGF